MKKVNFQIKGMHCEACARSVEKALLREEGIVSANVNFILGKATVEFDPEKISLQKIKKVIKKAGYEALEEEKEVEKEIKKGWRLFFLGLSLTIPVLLIATFFL